MPPAALKLIRHAVLQAGRDTGDYQFFSDVIKDIASGIVDLSPIFGTTDDESKASVLQSVCETIEAVVRFELL